MLKKEMSSGYFVRTMYVENLRYFKYDKSKLFGLFSSSFGSEVGTIAVDPDPRTV